MKTQNFSEMLKPEPGNIPDELKALPNWVVWKSEVRDGKRTKPPYDPKTGKLAKSNDPRTWATFDVALKAFEGNGHAGVGVVLTEEDPYAGFDLDHCRDPETGTIEPWAQKIVDNLGTYTEVSPSGTGIRGFLRGRLPPSGRKKGYVEMYETGRYLTITGHPLNENRIEYRQKELEKEHKAVFGASNLEKGVSNLENYPSTPVLDDQHLIDRAFKSKNGDKIQRLYSGDYSEHPSRSEADQALCNHLAFWFDRNPGAIDAAFRNSGLMREKWNEKHFGDGTTYGERTIQNAIAGTTSTYRQEGPQEKKPVERIIVLSKFTPRPFTKRIIAEQKIFTDKHKILYLFDSVSRLWIEGADAYIEAMLRQEIMADAQQKSFCIREILDDIKGYMFDPNTPNFPEPALNLIPFSNGVYNLETGAFTEFTPENYFTQKMRVNFNPDADCQMIDQIFKEIVNNPTDLIELIGYCFLREYPYQKMFFLFGGGGNGKSLFLNILRHILGEDNITSTDLESLQDNRFASSGLFKKLAAIAGEAPYQAIRNAKQIKALTGEDIISAERKWGHAFNFKNYAKVIISTNELPKTTDKTIAFYRRLFLCRFPNKITDTKKEKKGLFRSIPETEFEGLAYKSLQYLKAFIARGYCFTNDKKEFELRKEYERLTNPVSEFIGQFTVEDPNKFIPKWIFIEIFKRWQREKGRREWTDREIAKEMKYLGYETKQKHVSPEEQNNTINTINTINTTLSYPKVKKSYKEGVLPVLPVTETKTWRCWLGLEWPPPLL